MDLVALIAGLFLVALVVFAILFLVFEIYVVIIGHLKGAPFVRSSKKNIKAMIELADIKVGDQIVDLGSGDGTILLEAARRGAEAIGIEINPFLCLYSRWRIKRAGFTAQAKVLCGDFRDYSLRDADVVFLYLWPSTIEKLREKLIRELKPGALVISNGFRVPLWKQVMGKEGVYLYKKVS